ncbi:hypothetical protein KVR01_012854 [Diaporthe batatas]|uniref:uncharacterized protein n=1 Tax=Diaporthe batatas TaxID=748121 RepID=UPI001D056A87|nr:uncharacterized protein KVR01_012854 [Diaporthe batatas]KAG8157470.1 hypothetical protein KVR01_012854 [Diaporthe batatas]
MEDETAGEAEDNTRPTKAGEEEYRVLETALEKPSPFLQLAPEVRNMVYQHSCIYETPDSERMLDPLTFPNLRQAPITRVNKQIRKETLPIFYGNHDFFIIIRMPSVLDEILHGSHDPFKHVWQMLHSFATAPALIAKGDMQTSSLTSLSQLSFRLDDSQYLSEDDIGMLGFTMSSKDLICQDGDFAIETENLDWDRFSNVKKAYVSGILTGTISHRHRLASLRNSVEAHKRIDELISLMFFVARQCPQLKSHVLGFVYE